MPTKRDLRRLLDTRGEGERAVSLRAMLEARLRATCTLALDEARTPCGGITLTGTIMDVDDDWVLVEMPVPRGGTRLVALRLSCVQSIEETSAEAA